MAEQRSPGDLPGADPRSGGDRRARPGRDLAVLLGVLASGTAVLVLGRRVVADLVGQQMAPWLLGRASGFTAYVLLLALVVTGLVLSHPAASRLGWPRPATRLRLHIALAVFTLAFTVLHVVVLATDPWAQVGWAGAVLPMASQYRPVPVTLGVLAAWSALVTGVSAALAGRLAARVWWPVHQAAAVALVLVWGHGVLAGADTKALLWFYLASGALVLALGLSRYTARTAAGQVQELVRAAPAAVPRRQESRPEGRQEVGRW